MPINSISLLPEHDALEKRQLNRTPEEAAERSRAAREQIDRDYRSDGHQFFSKLAGDKTVFTVFGDAITSSDEKTTTAVAMVRQAIVLGWDRVRVDGTPEFKAEVRKQLSRERRLESAKRAKSTAAEARPTRESKPAAAETPAIAQLNDATPVTRQVEATTVAAPPPSTPSASSEPEAESNFIIFDRAQSEQRAQAGRDNAEVRERVARLHRANPVPAATAESLNPTATPAQQAATLSGPDQDSPTADTRPQVDVEARARALEAVMRRYRKVNDQFLLKDDKDTPAFRDKGEKLVTAHNDVEIARSMVDLAKAKGWDSIKVGGSKEFKQAVWLYAAGQGLDVAGYKPTDLDKVKLVELKDDVMRAVHTTHDRAPERKQPAAAAQATPAPAAAAVGVDASSRQTPLDLGAVSESPPPLTPRHEAALIAMETILRRSAPGYPNGHTQTQITAAMDTARRQWTNDRVYVGKILEHGPANYEFKKDGSPSYFARVEDPNGGKMVIWGVDLPRALDESKSQRGDDLVVSFQGSKRVEVPKIKEGPGGRAVEYEMVDRNVWNITPVRALAPDQAQEALDRARKSQGPNMQAVTQLHKPPVQRTYQGPVRTPAVSRGR